MTPAAIRPMLADDVNAVVDVHMKTFPGFFLTFLGPSFLRELYRGIVADPSGIGFVAESSGVVVGFVAGTAEPAGLYTRLLRQRFLAFAWRSAVAVVRRPSAAPRLWRALARPREAPDARSGRAELMSIAVLADARGTGLGARLIKAFSEGAGARGATSVYLTTDAVGNDGVNALYVRNGFQRSRAFATPEGRAMNEYEKTL